MKLISWNVNGLRACLGKGFMDFLKSEDADVYCLQEIKMQKDDIELNLEGYEMFFNSAEKKGYSGTAVFTKTKPLSVKFGMGIEEHDHEGRIITIEFEDYYLVNVYVPNAKRELERLDYRMVWEDDFRNFVKSFDKPVVICGDMNVAHEEIDIKNVKSNIGNAGFTYEERGKMTELLESGFIDSFRYLYPDKKESYTWWSYIGNARSKNVGWRLDYFIMSNSIKERLKDSIIYSDVMGSDHCPIGIVIE